MKIFTKVYLTNFRRLVTLFAICMALPLLSSAQNAIKKNVDAMKANGVKFTTIAPFETGTAKSAAALADYDVPLGTLAEGLVMIPSKSENERIKSTQPDHISMEIPGMDGLNMILDLYRAEVLTGDAVIASSDGTDFSALLSENAYYRGVVAGKEQSLVAVSFLGDEIRGLISYGNETFVLGKVKGAKDNAHVLYNNNMISMDKSFECGAIESEDYAIPESDIQSSPKTIKCVRVRVEIDNGLTASLGGSFSAVNYTVGLYNEITALYENDNIDLVVSDIFAWVGSSPYSGDVGNRLDQLSNNYSNVDLTALITTAPSGGIAYISGLCSNNFGVSVSSIYGFYNNIPSYSWDVNVTAHELGHNLSSPHTHACAWNGNNTAIDGCGAVAGYSEGCTAAVPSGGGTIMSYCHLLGTGINFNLGFGPQPTTRITNYINSRSCLGTSCSPTTGTPCTDEELTLVIVTDQYPQETSWDFRDSQNNVVASGGTYSGAGTGTTITESICIEAGCYDFTMYDSYGDGICCAFGNGSYTLTDADGAILASGGTFTNSTTTAICAGNVGPDPCSAVNFNSYSINSYGGNRDIGTFQIQDGGATIFLQNNALKSINLNYNVTPNTMLEFKFKSTNQAQVHGIGFNSNNNLALGKIFKVHGTLNNNQFISDYDIYFGNNYLTYVIEVGNYYSGSNLSKLFFLVGNANGPASGNGYFKDVKVYENGVCTASASVASAMDNFENGTNEDFVLFPNPASTEVQLRSLSGAKVTSARIYSPTGRLLENHTVNNSVFNFDLSEKAAGIYIIDWTDNAGAQHRERLVKTK